MRIVVDPGHGGYDPGACNTTVGVEEKAVNLSIATALHRSLLWAGHASLMTRDGDRYVTLSDRVALAKAHRADAFISIHCNAAVNRQACGTEVWTDVGDTPADPLATEIGEAMQAALLWSPLRRDDRDADLDKEGRFYVLRMTRCPAVLVECGFISHDVEARRLAEMATVNATAGAISLGICRWAERLGKNT